MEEIKALVAEAVSKEMEVMRKEMDQLKLETENLKKENVNTSYYSPYSHIHSYPPLILRYGKNPSK